MTRRAAKIPSARIQPSSRTYRYLSSLGNGYIANCKSLPGTQIVHAAKCLTVTKCLKAIGRTEGLIRHPRQSRGLRVKIYCTRKRSGLPGVSAVPIEAALMDIAL